MYKIIELTKENYNLYYPFNTIALSHAIPGAMGEDCDIIIVTDDSSIYHLNYGYDNWTKEDVLKICPMIKGGIFGRLKDVSKKWELISLGAGNFLFVNETICEQFISRSKKYKHLYRNWLKIIVDILFSIKYLFLDIDGVLNTNKYIKYAKSKQILEYDINGAIFDPNAIDGLKRIIDSTQAKIILSSTWRFDGLQKMKELWHNRNLPGKLIGITPHLTTAVFENIDRNEEWQKHPIGSRGMEIDEWLRLNANEKLNPYTYAIIDDENDFLLHQASHIVFTNPEYGITEEVANKVIDILWE